jgi:hypothetical protein
MPHKSKHKQQFRKQQTATATMPVTETTGAAPEVSPAVKAAVIKPRPGATAQSLAAINASRYPFLTSEVKWIGILAGIVVVILIILKIILPLFNI